MYFSSKYLVDTSQEKLKKKESSECFVSIKLPGLFLFWASVRNFSIDLTLKPLIYILYSNKMITLFLSFARAMTFIQLRVSDSDCILIRNFSIP
jgi:hypothetical protein